jgi:hypothetical protein
VSEVCDRDHHHEDNCTLDETKRTGVPTSHTA